MIMVPPFTCAVCCVWYSDSSQPYGSSLPIPEHLDRREQLRKERREEYQQLLASKRVGDNKRQRPPSVTELRRKLAENREIELARGPQREVGRREKSQRREPSQNTGLFDREETYQEMKERKRKEEKRYRAGLMDYSPDHHPTNRRSVRFVDQNSPERDSEPRRRWVDSGIHLPPPRHWEDEEEQYLQWARERGRYSSNSNGRRTSTPPSKQTHLDEDDGLNRSKSAPSVRSPDFMNLGKRAAEEDKKAKQKAYADELRRQIMEKDKEKALERTEKLGNLSSKNDKQSNDSVTTKQMRLRDTSPPPRHSSPLEQQRNNRSDADNLHARGPPPHWNGDMRYPPGPGYPHPAYLPQPLQYPPQAYVPQGYYYPPPLQPVPPLVPSHHPYPYYEHYDGQFKRSKSPPHRQNMVRIVTEDDDNRDRTHRRLLSTPKELDDSPMTGQRSKVSPQRVLDKDAYRSELERQIHEKKQRQLEDNTRREEHERNKEMEMEGYNPWGKGGCGAPIRDATGKPITDLRTMRRVNDAKTSPRNITNPELDNSMDLDMYKRDPSRLGSHTPHQAQFTSPEPDPRSQQEEYRKELKRQMEEKEEVKRKEKERQKLEEEREAQRLEMERKRMQEDYEKEQAIQRQKQEEVKAKNEALKIAAEEKRIAEARKVKEKEERERQELEVKFKREEHQRYARPPSPPVPAVKNHLIHQGHPLPVHDPNTPLQLTADPPPPARRPSPPVPALQNKLTTNKDVDYTSHVQIEQQTHHRHEPVVEHNVRPDGTGKQLDTMQEPRDHKLPGTSSVVHTQVSLATMEKDERHGDSNQDVLDKLSAVRRLLNDATSVPSASSSTVTEERKTSGRSLFEPVRVNVRKLNSGSKRLHNDPVPSGRDPITAFNQLKYNNADNRRRDFWNKFPEPPRSESSLEVQQAELLKHQEEILSKLQLAVTQHVEPNKENEPKSSGDLLPSESVYLDSDCQETRDQRNKVSRQKRRTWQISAKFGDKVEPIRQHHAQRPGSQVSTKSFDVDTVAQKNQNRLEKLDAVLRSSRDVSSRTPDEVIQQFLDFQTPYVPELDETESLSRMSEHSLSNNTAFKPIFPS